MSRLKVLSENMRDTVFEFNQNQHDCGRLAERSFVISDTTISGHHCTFMKDGDNYVLVDNRSTNGCKVNGEKINKAILRNGDIIRLGSIELIYENENDQTRVVTKTAHGIQLSSSATQTLQMQLKNPQNSMQKNIWIKYLLGALMLLVGILVVYLFVELFKQP